MAFKTMADNGIDISARQDGALYNASVGGDFVLKGIGNELSFSVSGLNVTVETGEAIIHGRHITAEESNTITLPSNSSGYLVLRLDLSQVSGNEAYLYATPVITTEEVNWNGTIHDMVIASFTTTQTVANVIDARRIVASTMGGSNITIESDGKPYIHYIHNGQKISKKLGSVEGTANTSDVLSGVTFMSATSEELQTGAMTNRGAINQTVGSGSTYTIPQGYHNGSGKVTGGYPTVSSSTLLTSNATSYKFTSACKVAYVCGISSSSTTDYRPSVSISGGGTLQNTVVLQVSGKHIFLISTTVLNATTSTTITFSNLRDGAINVIKLY